MSQSTPEPGEELVRWSADGTERHVSLVKVGQVMMPSWFKARLIENENGDPDVSFVFEVRNGAPECREVHIVAPNEGHEVRYSGLVDIRVEDVLEEAIKRLIRDEPTVADGRVNWPMLYPTDAEKRDAVHASRTTRAARKVKITDELLREVARVYRANVDARPTAAVAEHFDRSHRMAALYVKTARGRTDPETGKPFLGAALRGKAGEQ